MKHALLICFVLSGCGDDGHGGLPDAPRVDAPADTSIDAPPGMAKVTVLDSGAPVVGARVHWLNPDNSVALSTETDTDGTSEAVMAAGGSVTVVNPYNVQLGFPSTQLQTIVGVKPGDNLVMKRTSSGTSATMNVQLPADPGGVSFRADTTCGNSSFGATSGGQLFLYDCTTTDVLGSRADANAAVKWTYRPNVAVVEDGLIDLSNETYAAPVNTTSTYTNVPDASNGLTLTRTLGTSHGIFYACEANGQTTTDFVATLSCPAPAGVALVDVLTVNRTAGQHYVYEATTGGNRTVDLSGVLLQEFATSPTVVPATHSVDFTLTPVGATADFATASLIGYLPTYYSWEIFTPATTQIVFPTLPGADAMFNLAEDGQYSLGRISEWKVPGGYDAVRGLVYGGRPEAQVGTAGRVVIVERGRAL